MSKYKILLFDADATLLDFKKCEYFAVIDCLEYAKLPVNEEVISKYSEINDRYWKMLERGETTREKLMKDRWCSLFEFYGFEADADAVAALYPLRLAEKSYLMDGAEEICRKLCGKFKMYIVTNGFKKVQEKRFMNCPLSKYFDGIFISEDIGYDKPAPEYFDEIEKRIPNYAKNATLIIGDSLTSDIKGGINAGIDTCWYNPDGKSIPEGMDITYTVKYLSEIENIVL